MREGKRERKRERKKERKKERESESERRSFTPRQRRILLPTVLAGVNDNSTMILIRKVIMIMLILSLQQ